MSEISIHPDVRAFLEMLKANPRPTFTAEAMPALRAMAGPGMAMIDLPVGDVPVIRDFSIPGPVGDIPARLFDAREARGPGPAIVFFHGGGFVIGNIDSHSGMCGEIARRLDLPVISIDYRLAPEHPWPAAPDDAETAARWIAENGERLGLGVTSLVLCGDSAGANLTIVTALALRDRPAQIPVILQFALYPVTDSLTRYASGELFADGYGLDSVSMQFYTDSIKPEPGHWRYSPLYADQAGLPTTFVVTAEFDPLRDQGRAYAAKTILAGVKTIYWEAAGTIHGFAGYRRVIPSAQTEFAAMLDMAGALIAERR